MLRFCKLNWVQSRPARCEKCPEITSVEICRCINKTDLTWLTARLTRSTDSLHTRMLNDVMFAFPFFIHWSSLISSTPSLFSLRQKMCCDFKMLFKVYDFVIIAFLALGRRRGKGEGSFQIQTSFESLVESTGEFYLLTIQSLIFFLSFFFKY